ncbi:glycerol dehydrogenase [Magnetospirillum fulvum]|uniref:Glycerol dehydrogenase n=1 Tax=Magnetospirillum fulvum TaxID=1082 RepID=A0A1H6IET9_MAGFU|nr:glycerol dehydrogenase [Magnetospirillum fulvum]SEH44814.1 glycerol 2-dehydrogenase (NAD+) [Magnetospirillum fulvum]
MSQMLLAPRRYIQGDGAVAEIGLHAARLGTRALLVSGRRALAACGGPIEAALAGSGLSCHRELFGGECCESEIARLVCVAQQNGIDLVIAAGGGKVIDTGKVVAHRLKLPVIVLPTVAATDAPCSALSVIYAETGVFERYQLLPHNPDCVLVDTRIIANAPVETLVSGMGDALATFWEADTCARSCRPNVLTGAKAPLRSALALARLCYDTLLEHGLAAKLAVANRCVTPAVEAIVEANTLLSGLGFESGGLAGAHAIHNGLTVLKSSHDRLHGQKVAFGTLVQLVMEGRPAEQFQQVLEFCRSVGLPVCLDDLGIHAPTRDDIRAVAEAATAPGETIHATWFDVTAATVEDAIWTANALALNDRSQRVSR